MPSYSLSPFQQPLYFARVLILAPSYSTTPRNYSYISSSIDAKHCQIYFDTRSFSLASEVRVPFILNCLENGDFILGRSSKLSRHPYPFNVTFIANNLSLF